MAYRGQRKGDPVGLSWSLKKSVAKNFARGAGQRCLLPDGVIVTELIPRSRIMAYLTDRREFELISLPETKRKQR
jgi:hypothetical protein